jgi:transposase
MKTKNLTPSVVPTSKPATINPGGFTLGLDLGDRSHHVCVLDAAGQIVREGALPNTRPALAKLLADFPRATVALEAGTHSPWISRYLTGLGAHVLVANPRKLHAISRNERKCDQRDAQMLARLARVDPALLHPIQHGTAQAQHDLLGLKLRDALVRTRVNLINAIRFTLKSLGHPMRNPSSESFHKTILADVPADCLPVIQPLITVLVQVTEQIKGMERDLVQRSKKEYPATQRLQQIAGVGPLTALCFVLKIGDPQRFSRGRDVGAYLGLCPRRDQSGGTDKQQQMRRRPAAPFARQRRALRPRTFRPTLCPARTWPAPHRHRQHP